MLTANFRRRTRRSLLLTFLVLGILIAVVAGGHEVHHDHSEAVAEGDAALTQLSPLENLRAFRRSGDDRHLNAAWSTLESAIREPSVDAGTLLLAAEVAQARHRFDDAMNILARVLTENSNNDSAWLLRASIALVAGDIESARVACSSLRRLPVVAMLTCRARVQTASGNPERALSELEPLLQRSGPTAPNNHWTAWLWSAAGDAAAAAGDPRAIDFLERSLALEESAQVRAALVDRLFEAGRYSEATTVLDGPGNSLALQLRRWIVAGLLGQEQHYAQAVAQADREFRHWIAEGDWLHAREMARFYLDVLPDLKLAGRLARINRLTQREPEDLELVRRTVDPEPERSSAGSETAPAGKTTADQVHESM